MKKLFFPDSVAIFGVSNAPANLARMIIENLQRFGFAGPIYPLGDRDDHIRGLPVYRALADVPHVPDLAVLLIPATKIPDVLEQCGRKGIRWVVVESGGFSEFDEGRRTLEATVREVADRWGITVMGPNCVGVTNRENGLVLPFVPLYPKDMLPGSVSFISQSGGLVHDIMMLCAHEHVGLSKLLSVGNKLMVDENDFLEFLVHDPATKVIGLYLEQVGDGRRLVDLARSTSKPIALLKSNRSPSASEVARFHTAALAGDDRVVDAACRQGGIHRVRTLQEMVNTLKVLGLPPMKGKRVAVVTRSGGHAVLAADSVHSHGLELARFSEDFFSLIEPKRKARIIRMTNPLDIGDVFDVDFYPVLLEAALKEEGVDGVVFMHSYNHENEGMATEKLLRSAGRIAASSGKPVVFFLITNPEQWMAMKNVVDLPVFTEVDQAVGALRVLWDHGCHDALRTGAEPPVPSLNLRGQRSLSPSVMADQSEVFTLLRDYGLPVVPWRVVSDLAGALEAAGEMGYPVALKVVSPALLHKSDSGGVHLNLPDRGALTEAFQSLRADRYLVQAMSPAGYEVIVGGKRDGEFGPLVLAGLGGIFTEVLKDVAIRLAPVDEPEVPAMINELRGAALLQGVRGQPRADMREIARIVATVSTLMVDHPEIVHLDINPLIVMEEGKGAFIVDGKMEILRAD